MKVALDIHGVIDKNPSFYVQFCKALVAGKVEVHILTGTHLECGIYKELKKLGFKDRVHYTHLFSIADYHRSIGTKMWGDLKNPWMEDQIWNRTKGDYCERKNIDLCLDDKWDYLDYFATPIAIYRSSGK